MKITDNELLAKIAAATYGEIQDGMFMIVGQRHLFDASLYIGANDATCPDCYVVYTSSIPEDKDGVYNSSETADRPSLYDMASENVQLHFFTDFTSMLAFFNEYIATHNHMVL